MFAARRGDTLSAGSSRQHSPASVSVDHQHRPCRSGTKPGQSPFYLLGQFMLLGKSNTSVECRKVTELIILLFSDPQSHMQQTCDPGSKVEFLRGNWACFSPEQSKWYLNSNVVDFPWYQKNTQGLLKCRRVTTWCMLNSLFSHARLLKTGPKLV